MADSNNGLDKISALNPVGYAPKVTPKPMAPRLDGLDGKTIYLVDPRFDDSGLFLRQVQDWFGEHMPSATLVTFLFIWAGLIIYTVDGWLAMKRRAQR